MDTIDEFQNAIQRDLAWRKVEISNLKSLLHNSEPAAAYLFRAGQVLLCAHWEGFLKRASRLYAEHALSQKVKLRELNSSMVAFYFFNAVMNAAQAHYPGSTEHHIKLADKIIKKIDEEPTPTGTWKVDTEGNPGTDVAERIFRSLGLDLQLGMDEATWSTTRIFINEHLLKDRNAIAHGEGLRVDKITLIDRIERTLDLLEHVYNTLVSSALQKKYLKLPA